jgi:hypothetical protein
MEENVGREKLVQEQSWLRLCGFNARRSDLHLNRNRVVINCPQVRMHSLLSASSRLSGGTARESCSSENGSRELAYYTGVN